MNTLIIDVICISLVGKNTLDKLYSVIERLRHLSLSVFVTANVISPYVAPVVNPCKRSDSLGQYNPIRRFPVLWDARVLETNVHGYLLATDMCNKTQTCYLQDILFGESETLPTQKPLARFNIKLYKNFMGRKKNVE